MKTNIILIIVLIAFSLVYSGCIETGKSSVVDTVYDVGFNTFPWKTGFVYLTNDHPSFGGKGGYSAIYTFDKSDENLYSLLSEARDNKKLVKLYYTNNWFYPPWNYPSDSVALIYKAEFVNITKQ